MTEPHYYRYPKWHGTDKFKSTGAYFDTHGYYTPHVEGSIAYSKHWDREEELIRNGMVWDGQRIAGLHYLYLNYCPIWNKAKRRNTFPDFRAVDADWFLAIEKDLGLAYHNNNPLRPVGHVDGKTRQCLHGDTMIYTPQGFHTIAVMETSGYNGLAYSLDLDGNLFTDQVKKVWKQPDKEWIYEVKLKSGESIKTTINHVFNTPTGFKELSQIEVGEDLITNTKPCFGNYLATDSAVKLIGWMVTDGSCAEGEAPKFTNANIDYLNDFEQAALTIFPTLKVRRNFKGRGYDIFITTGDKSGRVINNFTRFLERYRLRGKIRDQKCIPYEFLKLPKEQTALLLNRMFAGDGWYTSSKGKVSYKGNEIGFGTESFEMVHQVAFLLSKFGIHGRITTEDTYSKPFYKFRFSQREYITIFVSEIGILGKKLRQPQTTINKKHKSLNRIVSITRLYEADVYDMELKKTESFLANNIHVHNCGHSLKAVVPLLYYMNFIKGAKCYLGAVEERYAAKTLKMYLKYHEHLYEYTDLGKGWIEKTKNKYYKTGYYEVVNNQILEKGYLSELTIVTFQDSAEKGVGGGCDLFIIEEAGLFKTVLDACVYISDACKDGDNTTGNILVYGAAGNLANCAQFSKLCRRPTDYDFAGYPNVHEKGKEKELVAYFVPNHAARPPHLDADGNPDSSAAIHARDIKHADLKKKDFRKWAQRMSQEPNTLKEMFDLRSHTRFSKELIEPHLNFLKARADSVGTRVSYWYDETNQPRYSFTVPDEHQPIISYPYDDLENTEGCILLYEFPPPMKPVPGLFIAAIDSYNFDDSTTTSMGHIIIYKQVSTISSENTNRVIVAEYLGRPKAGKHEWYRKCLWLMRIYNAKALVENEDPEIVSWFYNQSYDHMLADTPDIIRSIIPNTRSTRTKGIHAVDPLISAGENKIQRYLEEKIGFYHDAEGEVIGTKYGVSRIPSIGILEELLVYVANEPDINFDRERTFGWLLLYEEELVTQPIEEEYDPGIIDFLINVDKNSTPSKVASLWH